MEEEKTILNEVASGAYDASDMPFDFVEEGTETSLICEPDPSVRERITTAMQALGYRTTEAENTRDALKKSRFHVYHTVILNEQFDTTHPDANDLMIYLGALPMVTRRQMFIVLITERFRTMDSMAAFNKSVNLVINLKNMDDFSTIFKKGLTDHVAFYKVFKETLRKMGKG
jgi:CheY-like chemotaxis protein